MPGLDSVLAGDAGAIARLIRALDDELPGAAEALQALYPRGGQAFVVGVTGSPGVGKSTLTDVLVSAVRARGERVAVVAVDPSSPFTGGALLGDRVRMQRHATDPGVFIRSFATRGRLGGLSRSTSAAVAVLDAAGFPIVFVETVGAGQSEVDIADAADAVVVVTAPGLGDEIQALKVGLLEIADVLVVNKADRDGADRTAADLTGMLALGAREVPPVIRTAASTGQGVAELVTALERLRGAPPERRALRRRRQAARQLVALAGEKARDAAHAAIGTPESPGPMASLVDDLAARKIDPWTAARALTSGEVLG